MWPDKITDKDFCARYVHCICFSIQLGICISIMGQVWIQSFEFRNRKKNLTEDHQEKKKATFSPDPVFPERLDPEQVNLRPDPKHLCSWIYLQAYFLIVSQIYFIFS